MRHGSSSSSRITTCLLALGVVAVAVPLLASSGNYIWQGSAVNLTWSRAGNWTGASGWPDQDWQEDSYEDSATIDDTTNGAECILDVEHRKIGRLFVGQGHDLHLEYTLAVGPHASNCFYDGRVEFEGDVTLEADNQGANLVCQFMLITGGSGTQETVVDFSDAGEDCLLYTSRCV